MTATWKTVRVFISSTFRDMHAEREELVKRVFPQLRKLCEARRVTWGEVDLRWGVTDEQKAGGKVLPICLAEIHNCRPYFIGILGDRYGWVPDEIPPELIERESWLTEHHERSVTELEILHGVLNNPAMTDHAFFYFRSPSSIDSLPADARHEHQELATPEEIERFGAAEAERRAEERRRKLAALKSRIRASGFPVREDYADPRSFGELVLQDLTALIDRLYPEGSQPDPLEDLAKRGWPTLHVEPLDPAERRRLISEYLAQYTKTLSPDRVERIATSPQTADPLYLRALLDELRVYGDHLTLGQRIDHYLEASTVAGLHQRILERYEADYDRDRPGLVRDTMFLLWAARRGLSEAELLEMLGSNGEPLPRARWSPLYLAAEQSLVSRSGLIGFFHDYLRQAVRERYLATEEQQQAAHLRLADYFEARDLGPRRVDELPWQLAQAKSWQSLSALLSDLTFFAAAWSANQFDVKSY